MIIKIRVGNWRFTFSIARITDVVGVNSECKDGNHILMWDFDDVLLDDVIHVLTEVAHRHGLSDIHIFNTGAKEHYNAFCFTKMPWLKALSIVANTAFIDPTYISMSAFRERFTLRISDKEGRQLTKVATIRTPVKPTATVRDLKSFVKYETCTDNPINNLFFKVGDVEVWE